MIRIFLVASLALAMSLAADQKVTPTFLKRNLTDVPVSPDDLSSHGCSYQAVFGKGAPEARIARGVARFGVAVLDSGSTCAETNYPAEEQIYYVLEGSPTLHYGAGKIAMRTGDFAYLPPTIPHTLSLKGPGKARVIVMGYNIPKNLKATIPPKAQIANLDEVKKQVVGNHPPSTLYQLMMGDTTSTRDRLASATVMTSLFVMEFAPDGTNIPHHHDTEEEIYLMLDGTGEMVAGGGVDGTEGRYPAKPGDAYFIRLNTTVGFYNTGGKTAHILAVRSRYPFAR
jgi:mannose-6-phosphate isomerase-like protein (cupin superfamily)